MSQGTLTDPSGILAPAATAGLVTHETRDCQVPADSGWQAIEQAFARLYGEAPPATWRPACSSSPLAGINAYRAERPVPHWHYVTFGFSEICDKESSNPQVSGAGFELTLRLAVRPGEATAPTWPYDVLLALALYLQESGQRVAHGQTLDLSASWVPVEAQRLSLLAFATDPQLRTIPTPNGNLEFLQLVGVTRDELNAMLQWRPSRFLVLLATKNPLLVTDPNRASSLADPFFAQQVSEATRREGSSSGTLCVGSGLWLKMPHLFRQRPQIVLGATCVEDFKRRLLGRIPFGRHLDLVGDRHTVRFDPEREGSYSICDETLIVPLSAEAAAALTKRLRAKAGRYLLPGVNDLVIRVTT